MQLELGTSPSSRIITTTAAATRATDTLTLSFAVPDGPRTLRVTFDDGSTQDVPVTIAGGLTSIAGGSLARTRLRRAALL